ncbi:ABC transporter permease [Thiorhodococcus minor]|uniref:Iron ABC transporter permease n=1 Tax=Thiorhodococcus minor TaxID=57489 RepID=A0A6M0K6X4_9GAMM|nr:iron ABC transporter permease [Thiorhodococcus minor]
MSSATAPEAVRPEATPSAKPSTTGSSRRSEGRLWSAGSVGLALLMAVPVLVILGFVLVPAGDSWRHLAATVLPGYVANSLLLMLGVALGTLIGGVGTAWLTSMCQFPGRGLLEWALLLPMAMPAYIIAYTYTGMLDYAGPLQTALRALTGWGYGDYWMPEVRSLAGAAVMLSLVLYPYVYLLTRAAFLGQSICVLDVSRTLGSGPWQSFYRVALPLARPAIVAGLSLALMETLADYGTVKYFGVQTFTTGIFRTWYGLGDTAGAAQLSALLLGLVIVLVALEKGSRRHARYHHTSQRHQAIRRHRLHGWRAALALTFCALPVLLGFLIPAGQLGIWALTVAEEAYDARFLRLTLNSLGLAAAAALLALGLALLLGYAKRLHPSPAVLASVRLAGLGYALPGTVIAIGVIIPFAWLDNSIDAWMRATFGVSTGLLLSGTLAALLFAYLVRFLAVSLQTVEAGLGKIRPSTDDAARALGLRPAGVLWRVHVPLLRGTLLTAALLVFVDVLKELPATLILRPFNFNTLAVRAFELASDERLADSAPAALMIVGAGLIPVILLSRSITSSRHVQTP